MCVSLEVLTGTVGVVERGDCSAAKRRREC